MLNPAASSALFANSGSPNGGCDSTPPRVTRSEPAKAYRETEGAIATAAASEMAVRQSWLDAMETAFGATANRAVIVTALDDARQAVVRGRIGTNNTGRDFGGRARAI